MRWRDSATRSDLAESFLLMPASARSKKFLRVNEAATMMSVNPRTIQRWVEDGKLLGVQIGGRLWISRKSLIAKVRLSNSE